MPLGQHERWQREQGKRHGRKFQIAWRWEQGNRLVCIHVIYTRQQPMLVPQIDIRRPQGVAAVLLLLFAAQCFWAAAHRPLTEQDFRYAQCGLNLWKGHSMGDIAAGRSAAAGSCVRRGDGVFAYLAAGFPLWLANLIEEGISEVYPSASGQSASQPAIPGSSVANPPSNLLNPFFPLLLPRSSVSTAGEMTSPEIVVPSSTHFPGRSPAGALVLLRLPFIFFGVWLGGGLWWVSRRLYGNEGGFIALAFYCFSPDIIHHCVQPNNEILAAWGAYGVVYTGIGLAHAMQAPARKWRPRTILLAVALGLTAAAHSVAALLALLFIIGFMLYLGERRRLQMLPVLAIAIAGAWVIALACYGFDPGALGDGLRDAGSSVRLSWSGVPRIFSAFPNIGITIAAVVAIAIYLFHRRSRYFGNTTPLLVAAVLLSIAIAGAGATPWVWALAFVLTFIGGVFADGLDSRYRRFLYPLTGALLVVQAVLSVRSLPGIQG